MTYKNFLAASMCVLAGTAGSAGSTQAQQSSNDQAAKKPEISRIVGMEMGDRACYMELVDSKGKKREDLADFAICDKTNLVGKRVEITRKRAQVMSVACKGRENCSISDTVNLIVMIKEAK